MIVDSSVVVAIALQESELTAFELALDAAPVRRMSAGTWIELSAVATRRGIIPHANLATLLTVYDLVLEPVTVEQARIGHQAYRDYGIGSGHRAHLNLGDCFAYALARAMNEPLLFKGADFIHTDVMVAAGSSYPR